MLYIQTQECLFRQKAVIRCPSVYKLCSTHVKENRDTIQAIGPIGNREQEDI